MMRPILPLLLATLALTACSSRLTVNHAVETEIGPVRASAGVSRTDYAPWLVGNPSVRLTTTVWADGATSSTTEYRDGKSTLGAAIGAAAGFAAGALVP